MIIHKSRPLLVRDWTEEAHRGEASCSSSQALSLRPTGAFAKLVHSWAQQTGLGGRSDERKNNDDWLERASEAL